MWLKTWFGVCGDSACACLIIALPEGAGEEGELEP